MVVSFYSSCSFGGILLLIFEDSTELGFKVFEVKYLVLSSLLRASYSDSSMVNIKEKSSVEELGRSSEYSSRLSEAEVLTKQRKIAVMHELVLACISDVPKNSGVKAPKYGYDARQRVALRLLALWLNIEWYKVVCTFVSLFLSIFSFHLSSSPLR